MSAQELKKIFGINRVLLIAIFAILYYCLFFRFNVGIPDYTSERVLLDVSLELLQKYGESMEEAEYRDLLEHLDDYAEESEIDRWIKENEDYKQYGIESYEDWITKSGSLPEDAARTLSSQLLVKFTQEERMAWVVVFRKLYLNSLIETYDAQINQQGTYYPELSEKAEKRMAERNQEEIYSLIPYSVMRDFRTILPDFACFLFLSLIFLIVPYSVKDTMEGLPMLQYTSKKGCRFYWKKFTAVFLSSVILCAIEIGFFALMLNQNEAFSFTGCFVSGFWSAFITVVKLTFGQYIVLSLAYIAVMGLCFSMITYGLSSCAHNYISAIAFQIPTVICGFVVSYTLIPYFAEITQNTVLLCLVPCIGMFVAVIGNVVRYLSIRVYEKV